MFFPVPDEIYSDPSYLELSANALRLWTFAGAWSAHHLRDGYVPTSVLPMWAADPEQTAEELVAQRVWRRAKGGFQYVHWPKQATKAYVEAERERNREKQRRYRERGNRLRDPALTGNSPVSNRVSNGVSNRPQPTNQPHHHPSGGGGGVGRRETDLSTGELSTGGERTAFKKALDQAVRENPEHLRCPHGTPAGLVKQPGTTLSAACANCRREQAREQS